MKFIFLSLFLLVNLFGFSQYVLKGTVSNSNNEPIPGVRVFIENTTYGVITDHKGAYFLELNSPKQYPIAFRMIGMKDTTQVVNINSKMTILDMVLYQYSTELSTVDVHADKINAAKRVIKKMQDNRKRMANQFTNYSCITYQKTGLEKEKREFSFSKKAEPDTAKPEPIKMNLIESIAESKFISPGTYHETVLAYQDYSEKTENIPSSTESIETYFEEEIVPKQTIMVNPYIFFEKIEDGDFNLYQNMINLPKISEHPITSPIGVQAFTNYKFKLKSIFFESERKIYEIEVIPRFKTAALVSGSLYIIDELWVIKSFDLKVNSAAMPFFKDFTVIHDYEEKDGYWVPVRREFIYIVNDVESIISANTRVNHSDYKFNQTFTEKDFKNEIQHYDEQAFDRDSTFWIKSRPIQLKSTELDYIRIQRRIEAYEESEHYLDSVDAEYNKVTFWDITLNGVGFRNRFKQQEIYINPVLEGLKILGVGGFRYGVGGHYSKTFDNTQSIKISPQLDYGFRNRDLKGQLGVEYTFLPLKFGSVKVEGGDVYDMITTQTSIIDLFGRNNYVRNQFISLSHRRELINGLYGQLKFSYSDRQSIQSLELGSWVDFIGDYIASDSILTEYYGNFNKPVEFKRYKVSLFELRLQYRFKQKYIIKGNKKLIVGTEYPELELTYRKGVPGLFDSEVNFDFLELTVSDEINLGNYGDSRWSMTAGSFVNQVDLRFIENKFFRGSDFSWFSNPLMTHQTLDSTFYTSKPYMQAFYFHHFNGLFLNKIPLINLLKFESVAGASLLSIQDINYLHAEFIVGVERKFMLWKQYFKYGFYYTSRFNSTNSAVFRLKFGLDYFNPFTNSWTY